MSFRLSKESIEWFGKLRGQKPFDKTPLMDFYYLSFIIAFKIQKKISIENSGDEFIDRWPGIYPSSKNSIISLLIMNELKQMNIQLDEKDIVKKELIRFLNSDDPVRLSKEAIRELDNYAYAGFLYLREKFINQPVDGYSFLTRYIDLIL